MTPLSNDPAYFADEALTGFAAAYSDFVTAVPGGVIRRSQTRDGKVAVVIGGGSGHYPAFCGMVGQGLADGAAVGNVFTSPSTADVVSVCRAADGGAGVVLLTGNYAGDVMNFTLAMRHLQAEGVEARYAVVTDDVASAPPTQESQRRGIAGDVVVFKIAGAAAEAGYTLDDVERVVRKANDRTRTLGVAFDGCTLPGGAHPLFTVPDELIGIGVGIHGEPGIGETPRMPARELAALLVERIVADAPLPRGARVAVLLNGLGRTKYEELFVLWAAVEPLLRGTGLTAVKPDVGEFVTSLDMAGCSLTITSLDDELESLWVAPAYAPAYRKGVFESPNTEAVAASRNVGLAGTAREPAMARARGSNGRPWPAEAVAAAIDRAVMALTDHEEFLGRLDAIAGDGDHGRGMLRGALAGQRAAHACLALHCGVGELLSEAGRAWARAAGGTSGVLWGAMLEAAGSAFLDAEAGHVPSRKEAVGIAAGAVQAAIDAAQAVGGAVAGDKTILDALVPFGNSLVASARSDADIGSAWHVAARAAMAAAADTAQLAPRRGRARPLASKSVGHPDPGAVSFALMVAACADSRDLDVDAFVKEVDE